MLVTNQAQKVNPMQPNYLDKNKQLIVYMCLYFAFEVNVINVLYFNTESQLMMAIILGFFLIISLLRHFLMKVSVIKYLIPMIEAILIFSVNYFDVTSKSQVLLIILVADIVMIYSFSYSITFATVGYIVLLGNYLFKTEYLDADAIAQYVSVSLITYFSSMVIFLIVKNQIIQNIKYKSLMEKLMNKTREAEELAIFKERSRIAGEIHDTVGHTLTTILIELEAGRMLIDKDPILAKEKISIAKEQVKKGLKDIRSSVQAIKKGEDLLCFQDSVLALISETEKTTACRIQSQLNVQSQLVPVQEKILYHIIQEALTNGLKHGKATVFHLTLIEDKGNICLQMSDNGIGTKEIAMGFGLINMTERVRSIGGSIQFESKLGKGFRLDVIIPIGNIS